MKGILRILTVLIFCFVLVSGDRNDKSTEEDVSDTIESQRGKGQKRIPDRGGRCSCRDLENQVDQLEFRLDRMIDLWNDFVDKNRSPYDQRQPGPYPGGRTPPQGGIGGGRGPYLNPDGRLPPRRPGYNHGGRSIVDEPTNEPRRFRF